MSFKKQLIKRTTIFFSILLIATMIFYIGSFFSLAGFMFFEYALTIVLIIFFSIFFLFFEASELKDLGENSSRMFNLIAGGFLTLLLVAVCIYVTIGVAYSF